VTWRFSRSLRLACVPAAPWPSALRAWVIRPADRDRDLYAQVTQAWCVFFGANALTALWTAVWGSDEVWFYYNGIIAYLLAGLMFTGNGSCGGDFCGRWVGDPARPLTFAGA